MNFQDIISNLQDYWKKQGCIIVQPYDLEKGAGTFNPATFFGSLTTKPTSVAYVEPCRRPADGRYGENPNRLGKYYQFQVILKPAPVNVQELYLNSLKAIGLDPREHDVRWVEDDWQSPTLGASGVGWEVWLDGMEITQFTYFQNMAGYPLYPITAEITYGLERIAMYSQNKDSIFDLMWNNTQSFKDLILESERQFSHYYFEESNIDNLRRYILESEEECKALCAKGLYLPAYDAAMRVSHYFNMLEARGAISVSDRTNIITKIRTLAKLCASAYIKAVEPKEEK
ncbi:glycyl-tRNA synthetase alpha chain [Elusimicrobium simillimum]|uniref:glycine--tRNA ligase subunit alpha n=1 Tax=Elusimicrobium simillimum TaxID=3143438 RepID=UPI003C702194